jgi:seryl-tRNA synthetase
MNKEYSNSAPLHDADAISRFERIDDSLLAMACRGGAKPFQYPVLISREALEKAEYPSAFPHLLMAAAPLRDPAVTGQQQLEPANLRSPEWCLSPAVCYHVYSDFVGQTLSAPATVTARGRCFRHEATIDPGRRQIEFEMREIVLLGSADWISAEVSVWKNRLDQLLQQLELTGNWQTAEDPFFLPSAKGKAVMQRLMETKIEYCSNESEPIALASINRHGDFFGRRFSIRDSSGQFIHTACIAAGLDRLCSCAADLVKEVSV